MRSLSIFTLLVASASFASATTITITCGSVQSINGPIDGAAGSITTPTDVTCAAQDFGSGFNITNVSLGFAGSFSDPFPSTSSQVGFAGTASGGLVGNFGTFFTGTDGLSGNTGFQNNLLAATPGTQTFAAINVSVVTTSPGATIPNSGGYSVFANYTYESNDVIPEPSTLALVGGVLVLAGIRKFRS